MHDIRKKGISEEKRKIFEETHFYLLRLFFDRGLMNFDYILEFLIPFQQSLAEFRC